MTEVEAVKPHPLWYSLEQARHSLDTALTALNKGKPNISEALRLTERASEALQKAGGADGPDDAHAAVAELLARTQELQRHLGITPEPHAAIDEINQALDILEPVMADHGWD